MTLSPLRSSARWLLIGSLAILGGCAAAPGMTLDTGSKEVQDRADVFTIDLDTVRRLQDERRSAAERASVPPPAFRAPAGDYQYRVAPQDILRVTVWDHPELTNPSGTTSELTGRVVNGDGTMYFPYAGTFNAAGRTVQDIREQISQALLKFIKRPQVEVAVMQYRGQRVYVTGEVRTPGAVPITDVPPDLTQIVAAAGGATNDADLTAVTVTRGDERLNVDLQALYYGGDLRSNIRLQNGDVVTLPERRQSKIFVTGEVIRPTAVLMPRGPLTLADAITDAGGVNPLSASTGQIFVIRDGPASRPSIYHLDAAAPDALLLADRFVLNSRDVVFVDTAPVVRWARVMNNLLGSATVLRETINDTTRAFPR